MAVIRYFLSVLAVLTLSTWKYLDKGDPPFQNKSQEEEKEQRNVLEDQKMAENLKLHIKKNNSSTKQNLENRLIFKPAVAASSGSFPLDAVFVFLLIHMFGVDLVTAVSTVCHHMSSADSLLNLAVSFIVAGAAMYKWKRERSELVKKNKELQDERQNTEKERDDVVGTLVELKAELEDQRGRLRALLEDMERQKEGNRQKLQEVEKEIMEKERTFDKPEELLKEKEDLLRVQWKLDQTKKEKERQLLNTERLLEPIEGQVTRIQQTQGDDLQI